MKHLILIIGLLVWSCGWQQRETSQETQGCAIFSVELFHTLHQSGVLIVVNLNSLEVFLKPTGKSTLELPPPPPAGESTVYEFNDPELKENSLEVELIRMNNEEREILAGKVQKLQGIDLESSYNFEVKDGMSVRIDLVNDDLETKNIILVNDSTENQRELLKVLVGIVKNNTTKNKDYLNSIFPM